MSTPPEEPAADPDPTGSRPAVVDGVKTIGLHFPFSLLCIALLVFASWWWWSSARYSERHLFYLGDRSVEVFSASSLVRMSFADGRIGTDSRYRGYRQPNARGRMTFRPAWPSSSVAHSLWEVTFGHWHLVVLLFLGFGLALGLEGRRFRSIRGKREKVRGGSRGIRRGEAGANRPG